MGGSDATTRTADTADRALRGGAGDTRALARRPKSAQALALRCRIVLAAAEGELNRDIAERLGCSPTTVGKWRSRFARLRLDGLHDEPRPGRARSITDEDVERVITKTLEETPLTPPTGRRARWPGPRACPSQR
jgi:DNA-binding CsgD family transcriptional regulator